MKLHPVLPAAMLLFLCTSANEQGDGDDVLEKLDKLAEIYNHLSTGVGPDEQDHKPFPQDSPQLYQDEEALNEFLRAYKRGLLGRYGVFTINSPKIRKDTKAVFDLLYFSKDFDTFCKISEWALGELNRMEFGLAFLAATMHREDTRSLFLPPLYEIIPDYFTPASVMHRANIANMRGEHVKKFMLNNTGNEWSWHREMMNGPTRPRQSYKWNGDDSTSRLSYFREDVNLANTQQNMWMMLGGWLDSDRYPIKFRRAGEKMYHYFHLLLRRYNMERLSNGLPPVQPLDHDAPIQEGYNSGLADLTGRNLALRPNGAVASKLNPDGIVKVKEAERRLAQLIDMGQMKNMTNNEVVSLDGNAGLDLLAKIVFSRASATSPDYYKPLFMVLLEAYDNMLSSANNVDYNPGTLGSLITAYRDPVFYRLLATVMKHFDNYLSKLPPYTNKQLGMDGVVINSVETSELMTTFDRHTFSLNNGVEGADWDTTDMTAYQFRLNVKPFSYQIKVTSETEMDAYMKIFVGPKTDALGKSLSLEQARKLFYIIDFFKFKLVPGENLLQRSSNETEIWTQVMNYKTFRQMKTTGNDPNVPFSNPQPIRCGLPMNLMLPRGWKQGKQFQLFVIALPVRITEHEEGYFPCRHNSLYFDNFTDLSPFDRSIPDAHELIGPNMLLKDVTINNEF